MMIRSKEHNGKNYILIYTTLKVEKEDTVTSLPVHIQVDITKLPQVDTLPVHTMIDKIYNHTIIFKIGKPAPKKTGNSWWKKIFK